MWQPETSYLLNCNNLIYARNFNSFSDVQHVSATNKRFVLHSHSYVTYVTLCNAHHPVNRHICIKPLVVIPSICLWPVNESCFYNHSFLQPGTLSTKWSATPNEQIRIKILPGFRHFIQMLMQGSWSILEDKSRKLSPVLQHISSVLNSPVQNRWNSSSLLSDLLLFTG